MAGTGSGPPEPTIGDPGVSIQSLSLERARNSPSAQYAAESAGYKSVDDWWRDNSYQGQFQKQLRDNGIIEGSPEWEAAVSQFEQADWREQQSRVEGVAATASGRVGLIGGPVLAGKETTQTPEEWFRSTYVNPDGTLRANIGGLAAGEPMTPEMIAAMSSNSELMGALYEKEGVAPGADGKITTLDTWNTSGGQLQAEASFDTAAKLQNEAGSFQGRKPVQLDTTRFDESRELTNQALYGMDADREAASRAFGKANEEAAANREMALAGYADANAQARGDYGRAVKQFGLGNEQLDYLLAVQRGEAGPSLAEQQSNRMLGEQVQSQMAMAKSGSAFSPEAQRQAAMTGDSMAASQRQQIAELRAAEQMAATGQYNSLLGQQASDARGLAGLTYAQQQALLGQYGQLSGDTRARQDALAKQYEFLFGITAEQARLLVAQQGMDLGVATTQAGFDANQRALNDAMQGNQQNLALQYLQHGTGLESQQAINDLALYGTQVGQGESAANRADAAYRYNQDRQDKKNAEFMQALGGLAEGAAQWGASASQNSGGQGGQTYTQPTTEYSYAPGVSSEGGYYSDPRSKEIIAQQQSQIQSLLQQLKQAPPPAAPQQPSESDRTLANLAGVTAPSWRYTEQARAAAPESTGPGTRIGYTTEQLKRAGPAGRSMVSTDPRTGMEQIDPGAASTFSLAALGQQQREIDRLKSELDAMQKARGGLFRG